MPGVGLIKEPALSHPYNPIQDSHLLIITIFEAKAASDFDLEGLLEGSLVPVQRLTHTKAGEVVSMDHTLQLKFGMEKATWGCDAGLESHVDES